MPKEVNYLIKEFSAGKVTASIFQHEVTKNNKTYSRYSTCIKKSFKRSNGEWEDTNYYFPEDLPDLEQLASKVYEHLKLKEKSDDSNYDDELNNG